MARIRRFGLGLLAAMLLAAAAISGGGVALAWSGVQVLSISELPTAVVGGKSDVIVSPPTLVSLNTSPIPGPDLVKSLYVAYSYTAQNTTGKTKVIYARLVNLRNTDVPLTGPIGISAAGYSSGGRVDYEGIDYSKFPLPTSVRITLWPHATAYFTARVNVAANAPQGVQFSQVGVAIVQ